MVKINSNVYTTILVSKENARKICTIKLDYQMKSYDAVISILLKTFPDNKK